MKMHIHGQLRKYFDLMASIVRRVLDKHEFSEKDFSIEITQKDYETVDYDSLIRF